jgi:hypothetical protein
MESLEDRRDALRVVEAGGTLGSHQQLFEPQYMSMFVKLTISLPLDGNWSSEILRSLLNTSTVSRWSLDLFHGRRLLMPAYLYINVL